MAQRRSRLLVLIPLVVFAMMASAPAAMADPKEDKAHPEQAQNDKEHPEQAQNDKAQENNGNKPPEDSGSSTHQDQATSGDPNSPQPASNADHSGHGANQHGAYDSTRDGSPSQNGSGNGNATGRPCAGCVGRADNKNPPGQEPHGVAGADHNNGYECDGNNGVGKTNPAHTGCKSQPPPPCEPMPGEPCEPTPPCEPMPGKPCEPTPPCVPMPGVVCENPPPCVPMPGVLCENPPPCVPMPGVLCENPPPCVPMPGVPCVTTTPPCVPTPDVPCDDVLGTTVTRPLGRPAETAPGLARTGTGIKTLVLLALMFLGAGAVCLRAPRLTQDLVRMRSLR